MYAEIVGLYVIWFALLWWMVKQWRKMPVFWSWLILSQIVYLLYFLLYDHEFISVPPLPLAVSVLVHINCALFGIFILSIFISQVLCDNRR